MQQQRRRRRRERKPNDCPAVFTVKTSTSGIIFVFKLQDARWISGTGVRRCPAYVTRSSIGFLSTKSKLVQPDQNFCFRFVGAVPLTTCTLLSFIEYFPHVNIKLIQLEYFFFQKSLSRIVYKLNGFASSQKYGNLTRRTVVTAELFSMYKFCRHCCHGVDILISTRNRAKSGLHIYNSVTGTMAKNFSKLRVPIMIFCRPRSNVSGGGGSIANSPVVISESSSRAPACDQLIIMSILFILVLCRRFFVPPVSVLFSFGGGLWVSAEFTRCNYIASDIIVRGYSILLAARKTNWRCRKARKMRSHRRK